MSSNESSIDAWFKGKKQVSEIRVYSDIKKLLKLWQPESDIRALTYGYYFPVGLATFPGMAVNQTIINANRLNYGISGKLLNAILTVGVPAAATLFGTQFIEKDILLGLTPCSVCLETRAVCIQMCTGVIVPSLIGMMSANHVLVSSNWKKQFIRGLCLDKRDLLKCKNIIIGSAIIQAVAMSILVNLQSSEWINVREELTRRKEASQRGRKSSTRLITSDALN